MALEFYAVSSINAGAGIPRFGTAAEKAHIARSDLRAWFDARGRSVERTSNDRFTEFRSRKAFNDFQQPKLIAPSEAQGMYGGIVPGGTARYEFRVGRDGSDALISAFNNKLMTGNGTFVVPATDFTIYWYLRIPTVGTITMLLGTTDTTAPMAVGVTSTAIRWYSAYPGTFIASTVSPAWPDVNYHKLKLRYDATAKQGEISVDATVVRTMAALDLSGHVGKTMRIGSIVSGGSTTTAGNGFAFQSLDLVAAIDGVTTGLLDAVLAERLP